MKALLFLTLFITAPAFALGNNYLEENMNCVALTGEPAICEMSGCKMIEVTVVATGEEKSVCISPDRVKYCFKLSTKQHRCQRSKCFYNFEKNICYPRMFQTLDINRGVTRRTGPSCVHNC